MNEENLKAFLNLPESLTGACFHGECWIRCPHCKHGIEMYGMMNKEICTVEKFRVYECPDCHKLFKDRICY